jgi:hypothetical protein
MTVAELIQELKQFDGDLEVECFHPHEESFNEPRFELDEIPEGRKVLRLIGREAGCCWVG